MEICQAGFKQRRENRELPTSSGKLGRCQVQNCRICGGDWPRWRNWVFFTAGRSFGCENARHSRIRECRNNFFSQCVLTILREQWTVYSQTNLWSKVAVEEVRDLWIFLQPRLSWISGAVKKPLFVLFFQNRFPCSDTSVKAESWEQRSVQGVLQTALNVKILKPASPNWERPYLKMSGPQWILQCGFVWFPWNGQISGGSP